METVYDCVDRVNVETKELGLDLAEAVMNEVFLDEKCERYSLESLRADVMDRLYDLGYDLKSRLLPCKSCNMIGFHANYCPTLAKGSKVQA